MKTFMPKTMPELCELFYGKNIDYAKRRQYGNWIHTLNANKFEDTWKNIFETCGFALQKVKEINVQQPDFICSNPKLAIEVTSIVGDLVEPPPQPITLEETENRISTAIEHVFPKFKEFQNHTKICSLTIGFFPLFREIYKFFSPVFHSQLREKLLTFPIDALAILPAPINWNDKPANETFPPICIILTENCKESLLPLQKEMSFL